MKLTPQFIRDYEEFCRQLEWIRVQDRDKINLHDIKELVGSMRGFLDRWVGRTGEPEVETALQMVEPKVQDLEGIVKNQAIEHFLIVLRVRQVWLRFQLLFKVDVAFLKLTKEVEPAIRDEISALYLQHFGAEFDATEEYLLMERATDCAEASFEKTWHDYQTVWPERATPELHLRIVECAPESLTSWIAETEALLPSTATTPSN